MECPRHPMAVAARHLLEKVISVTSSPVLPAMYGATAAHSLTSDFRFLIPHAGLRAEPASDTCRWQPMPDRVKVRAPPAVCQNTTAVEQLDDFAAVTRIQSV